MSASKQKRIRNELRGEGPDQKVLAQQEAALKSKKFKRNTVIALVVVIVLVAGALFINSDYLYAKAPAVVIDDTTYTATDFNYYYRTAYSAFQEQYSSYLSLFIDLNTPLDEQQCLYSEEEDYTWADYFTDQALASMKSITALYDDAMAKGFTLSDEHLAELENNIKAYTTQAETNGYTLDAFLALTFGKGMNEENFRGILEKHMIANYYGASLAEGFSYTDEELDEHYRANLADRYDRISYHVYFVSGSNKDFENLSDEAAKLAAAHERAAAIADASTGAEFADNLYETLSDDDKELFQGEEYTLSDNWSDNLFSTYSEWLLDAERKPGDSTVIDDEVGSYALLFLERDNNDYNMVNFRHILCNIELDENGEYTEDARATAEAKANILLSLYNADPGEVNFATMAVSNSDDTDSASVGGLFENVYKGTMVPDLEAFCFAEGREPGDVAIVYGENPGTYAGYHIVYYVGEGENFADSLAKNDLVQSDYTAYVEQLSAAYSVEEQFGLKFAELQ